MLLLLKLRHIFCSLNSHTVHIFSKKGELRRTIELEHKLADMSKSGRPCPFMVMKIMNLDRSCFTYLRRWPRNIVSFNQRA